MSASVAARVPQRRAGGLTLGKRLPGRELAPCFGRRHAYPHRLQVGGTERDFYEVLGVPRSADDAAIRRAFRRLARELHPDVSGSPDAEQRFQELSAAYSVLSAPRERLLYDRHGYRGRFGDGSSFGPASVLGEVELQAFEAAWGTRRAVLIGRDEPCAVCAGSGYARGDEVRVCGTCAGRGTLRVSSGLGSGRWLQVEPCGSCAGDGRVRLPCPDCGGEGTTRRERTITVRIAPGVQDGARLRVVGEPENAHLLVRVLPRPPESLIIRYAAAALFVLALAFLVFLLQTT